MKKSICIIASLDEPELLENMIEKLACRRADHHNNELNGDWQLLDTSSVEKYVSGTVELSFSENEKNKIPFITSFLFSCTKEKNDPYKLNWSMSLS